MVDGDYEMAQRRGRESCTPASWLASDTGSNESDEFPRWMQEGYSSIAIEIEEKFAKRKGRLPDAVFVPIGVGGLAAAVATGLQSRREHVVAVEALEIAYALTSVCAGGSVAARGSGFR